MFISADAAQEMKRREKVLLPAGVLKSVAHTVIQLTPLARSL
jgi:hypothetical protein